MSIVTTKDLLIVSALIISVIFIFSRYLMKCLGFFHYKNPEEEKTYQEWLKKVGRKQAIASAICIAFFLSVWMWILMNW
jgi:formate hydrogenlyase subunit 3/multisubunit Na+/H+ antiporter MnhD subunit